MRSLPPPMLLSRSHKPANLESNYAALSDSPITPNSAFFVRDHFATPRIAAENWAVSIEGACKKPLKLSLNELKKFPSQTHSSVIECAGNSRLFLDLKPEGVQWELGAVGCASWTGVPLAKILEKAAIDPSTVELVLEGYDHGVPEKPTRPKAEIHYSRSLPIAVARRSEVLLVYEMNGEPLPAAHGAPVRVVVPGWYGMASVKWLRRIVAVKQPFHGYFQTVEYTYWAERANDLPERVPLREMAVKSQIARPSGHERIPVGTEYRVFGAAWTGDGKIKKVEVSTDGGKKWNVATLGSHPPDHAWRLWEYLWKPRSVGKHILMSRATDSRGSTQPARHDENRQGYMINHTIPIEVEVLAARIPNALK